MSADKLPHCPDCGYTEQDESIHMDHYRCEVRGGAIPRIRWQDHVELQRRMDAVRAWAETTLLASADDDGPEIAAVRRAARHVLTLLDGEDAR